MSAPSRAEVCAVAIADAFRGDGEILASPIGLLPTLGARLARRTFAPDLLLTDGVAFLRADTPPLGDGDAGEAVIEGWMPYRCVFDTLWAGRRHVMMGATQIDRFGNQNIAGIGDPRQPKAQLLGMRGAPGNTICHTTSYWVPRHGPRVFVEKVDVVCGIGYDRAAALGERAGRFHEIRRVVSDVGVFDFETRERRMRLRSVHPGVGVEEVVEKTGFELVVEADLAESRLPTDEELRILREELDPSGLAQREVAG